MDVVKGLGVRPWFFNIIDLESYVRWSSAKVSGNVHEDFLRDKLTQLLGEKGQRQEPV